MKKLFLSLFLLTSATLILSAQNVKKEAESTKTKMDVFSSKTGSITKFIDTKLPNLKTSYSSPETRIRKASNANVSAYFYQIEKEGKYNTTTASIEYSDLLELIKALDALRLEESKDISSDPDYLENKFTTVDGFQIGYFVSKAKSTWYIKLERFGSDNTVFINDVDIVKTAFTEAKQKIEELKK